ncbi:MAG TPA: helix-turn-helix domain-containing protein [Phenylobacterium sp.]|jgi:AraC-like DNA-binding protein
MTKLSQITEDIHSVSGAADLSKRLRAGMQRLSEDEIGLADFFRLLHELATEGGEETFSLSARPMMAGTAEFVFSSAAHCATVGEAMQAIARAYNLLHGDEFNQVETSRLRITYLIDDERFPYTVARDEVLCLSLECTLIVLHSALCHLAGLDLTPRVTGIATGRGRQQTWAKQALAFWNQPVRCGSRHYAITYEGAVAGLPLAKRRGQVRPGIALHNRIISQIEARRPSNAPPPALVDQVIDVLRAGLLFQDQVAARLGVSVATLRRRLEDEATSFRVLRRRVLSERARQMLAEGSEIDAVAEALGFSDARSFARAFTDWSGVSPAAWVKAARPR